MSNSKKELLKQLENIRLAKLEIVKTQKYEYAAALRDQEKALQEQLSNLDSTK